MAERLTVSKKAYLDIDRIIEFNNKRNQSDSYSRKFVKGIFKEFKLLSTKPLMGIQTDQTYTFVLIWDDYYIFYFYDGIEIVVNSIYHQKEDVQF